MAMNKYEATLCGAALALGLALAALAGRLFQNDLGNFNQKYQVTSTQFCELWGDIDVGYSRLVWEELFWENVTLDQPVLSSEVASQQAKQLLEKVRIGDPTLNRFGDLTCWTVQRLVKGKNCLVLVVWEKHPLLLRLASNPDPLLVPVTCPPGEYSLPLEGTRFELLRLLHALSEGGDMRTWGKASTLDFR